MIEGIINDWLTDCADLSTVELTTFANTLSQDDEIVQALYLLFEERTKYNQLVESVLNQLFNFYRSREVQLQRFSLQFLPTLIYIYLNSAAHGDIKNCRTVETLLVGIYNLELVNKDGEPKVVSFRLPSFAMMSIYHKPSSLTPASLTESAIQRFEKCNTKLVTWGPLKHVETLNAQNRLKVMTALLFIFNQHLGFFKKSALEQLCKVASKIVTQGFMKPGHHQRTSYGSESSFVPRLLPRIPVSSQFLLEFLHAIYFAMYNNYWHIGVQAVEDIHNRVCYEIYPDAMLVTNAIRNSSSSGPTGQSSDGSLGVSVTSSTSTAPILKSMITNASFRTKKLPGISYFTRMLYQLSFLMLLEQCGLVVRCVAGSLEMLGSEYGHLSRNLFVVISDTPSHGNDENSFEKKFRWKDIEDGKARDDLDQMLFKGLEMENEHMDGPSSSSMERDSSVERTSLNSARRRAWLWKNPLHNSFDDTDIAIADKHHLPPGPIAPSLSTENSRRGSINNSIQSSPNRSSPKRNREVRVKKSDLTGQSKSRKDSFKDVKETKEASQLSGSIGSKPNIAQRLYRVLEEQALGEAVGKVDSSNGTKSKQNLQ